MRQWGVPGRASKKRPRDVNARAFQIVQEATGQAPPEPPDTRNPAAVALRTTPAQAAGVTDRLWEIENLVGLLEG